MLLFCVASKAQSQVAVNITAVSGSSNPFTLTLVSNSPSGFSQANGISVGDTLYFQDGNKIDRAIMLSVTVNSPTNVTVSATVVSTVEPVVGVSGVSIPPGYNYFQMPNVPIDFHCVMEWHFSERVIAQNRIEKLNVIDAGTLTATTHNWEPIGLSTARGISVNVTATDYPEITGIVVPVATKFNALTLFNRGTKIAVLSNQHSSSTAANRFAFENDFIELLPGSKVELWYDAFASRWRCDVPPPTPSVNKNYYYDFANDRFGQTTISSTDRWATTTSGGTTAFSVGSSGSSPYNHVYLTVTTAAQRAVVNSSSSFYVGDKSAILEADAFLHVGQVSDGTNNTTWIFGFSQTTTPSSVNKGAFFYAGHVGDVVGGVTLATTNWHCVLTQGGSSATVFDSGIAPATTAATAQHLQLSYGSWGARFYVNGTLVTAPTANTNFASALQLICGGEKRAGTTAHYMTVFRLAYRFLDNF